MATHTLYRSHVPWQFRLLGWFCLTAAMLVVVAFAAIVSTGAYYEFSRTTGGDVEAMIERDLPARATTEQIIFFLETHEIARGDVQPSAASDKKLLDAGVPTGTPTISGRVSNDGIALQLRDVVVSFTLDAEGLLDDYFVYEVGR
jgi:hypothetical protein